MIRNRSSIFSCPSDKLPLDESGNLLAGYVLATKPDLPLPPDELFAYPRHVLHGAPGAKPPELFEDGVEIPVMTAAILEMLTEPTSDPVVLVIVDGMATPWTPEQIVAAWPEGHKYVMEAAWMEEGQYHRSKIIEIPEGVTPLEAMLVPHQWAGDEFEQ